MARRGNNALKRKARLLSRTENIPYSAALARLSSSDAQPASRPVLRPRGSSSSHTHLLSVAAKMQRDYERMLRGPLEKTAAMQRQLQQAANGPAVKALRDHQRMVQGMSSKLLETQRTYERMMHLKSIRLPSSKF